jgi:hypothetical protein
MQFTTDVQVVEQRAPPLVVTPDWFVGGTDSRCFQTSIRFRRMSPSRNSSRNAPR